MNREEIDLGNGLVLKLVTCDPFNTGHADEWYEIWDLDPVDDMPVFTGDYLTFNFVNETLDNNTFENAADILYDEIFN